MGDAMRQVRSMRRMPACMWFLMQAHEGLQQKVVPDNNETSEMALPIYQKGAQATRQAVVRKMPSDAGITGTHVSVRPSGTMHAQGTA
jgi:hypothetical protein